MPECHSGKIMFRALVLGTMLGGLTAFTWLLASRQIHKWYEKTREPYTQTVQAGGWVITFEQRPIPRPLIVQILPVMGGAFVFTWLLLHTRGLSYTGRVVFITIAGLVPTALALIFHPSW